MTVEVIDQQSYGKYRDLGLDKEVLLDLYNRMLLARRFEEKVETLYSSGRLKANYHLYIGQEAIAAGVISKLMADDFIISNYRGHGHALARGVPPRLLMAELFGKSTGTCQGVGGSMHCPKFPELNLIYATSIVGSGIPIAAGIALALKLRKRKGVVVVFFGDGAVNTGAFHEGMNMAAIWRIPLVLVCENNQYGISERVDLVTAGPGIAQKAESYGMQGIVVDGNDAVSVSLGIEHAIERAKNGEGPSLLECKTYRIRSHSVRERDSGRPADVTEDWKKKDPLEGLRTSLIKGGYADEMELTRMSQDVDATIEESVAFAEQGARLQLQDLQNLVEGQGN